MTEVKQVTRPAAGTKKKTTRKKAAGTRQTASKTATKKRATAKKAAVKKVRSTVPASDERRKLIAETAFLKAERRGFKGGDPVDDWLEAEREVDASLTD